jgi:hypothetical protein
MMNIASSPERYTFQRDKYIERQTEKNLMDDPETIDMLDWYKSWDQEKREREQDPEWQKDNLEFDLRTTGWILKKVRESDSYAQNLYAAMCNTDFIKNDVWPILKEKTWSCSWRYAGGIIADMREQGDYIDWYCSGIGAENGNVCESVVTDEIREDLLKLGWIVRDNDGLE